MDAGVLESIHITKDFVGLGFDGDGFADRVWV